MILLFVFTIYPFIYNLRISFLDFPLYDPRRAVFVGLENYLRLLTSSTFWSVWGNTLIIIGGALVVEVLLGLGMALVLNQKFYGRGLMRTLFVLPMGVMPVVSGLIWKLLFFPGGSLVNDLLMRIGVLNQEIDFWSNVFWSRVMIMAGDVWVWTPFLGLIFLAGLQAIPEELYEAARIDGASGLSCFRYITLPLLKYTFVVGLLFRVMDLLRIFDLVYIMTKGAPGTATTTISYLIFRTSFQEFEVGYGAALAVLVYLVVFVLAQVIIKRTGILREQT